VSDGLLFKVGGDVPIWVELLASLVWGATIEAECVSSVSLGVTSPSFELVKDLGGSSNAP